MYVMAGPNESFDQLLRRFKQGLEKSGILREFRRRQRFRSESELRRDKEKAAARRRLRHRRRRRFPPVTVPANGQVRTESNAPVSSVALLQRRDNAKA
jgi:small subunit ribosomal protein S21